MTTIASSFPSHFTAMSFAIAFMDNLIKEAGVSVISFDGMAGKLLTAR